MKYICHGGNTMNIAYCSMLLPEEKKLAERSKERLSGISLHKVTRAVIKGLDANLDEPVKVFNIINTLNYPKFPDLIFKTEKWRHTEGAEDWHIGYINLFGIKYITQAKGLFRKLDAWVKTLNGEPCMVCVHHIYYPMMKAACRLKKKYSDQVKICLFTGDMNGKCGLASQYKPNLKEKLTHFVEYSIDKMAPTFDCFVLATKYMADGFGVSHKPYTVLECTYTAPAYYDPTPDNSLNPDGKKAIFYAGALRREYGTEHLLRAFSMIKDPDYRLWLAGDGNARETVCEYAAKDPRIKYLGFITPQEVDLRQKNATIVISSRTSELMFVKYSFASKTLEGLVSGKPYVAHRLPCDPPEYADYIQYAEDDSDEALRDKIVEICELPKEQRDAIGKRARDFVLREKNPEVMCRRIIDMWKEQLC